MKINGPHGSSPLSRGVKPQLVRFPLSPAGNGWELAENRVKFDEVLWTDMVS
jgi:hypothetical protein